jgi:hypothetical protein
MKLFVQSIFFLITITALTPFAYGSTIYWAGGVSASASVGSTPPTTDNNFNTATNWSTVPPNLAEASGPQFVPSTTDIAVVLADLNNGTIVDDFYTGRTATPVVINQTTQGNTVQGLVISDFILPGGIVDFSNTSGQPLTVHGTNSSDGDFVVNGGTTFNYTSGTFQVTNGFIAIGEGVSNVPNTQEGTGAFNIQSGAFTFDASGTSTRMIVGYAPFGAEGGSGSSVTQGTATTSSTVTLGSSLILGFNSSTGSWSVTNGSLLQTGTQASSYLIALGSNGNSAVASDDNGVGSTWECRRGHCHRSASGHHLLEREPDDTGGRHGNHQSKRRLNC